MKEFNIIKRLRDSNTKGSLVVFRLSYTKNHNNELENLFNFSLWFGEPNTTKKTGSYEIFVWKHKGLKRPHLALIDWNNHMRKRRLEDEIYD